MFRIKNSTGYRILLPDGRYVEPEKEVLFSDVKELPEAEDISMIGYREEKDAYVYMTEYQRDSFGEIISEYRINYYLL
jgi:hypothetical protein